MAQLNRFRGPMTPVFLATMPDDAQAASSAQPNITDVYDPARMVDTDVALHTFQTFSPDTDSRAAVSISMRDAVSLSVDDAYKSQTDLNDDQKKLIALVAEDRKSADGRKHTDESAARGDWLVTTTNNARTSTISMRDAISLAADNKYQTRTDLSDGQKKLIDIVVEERKSDAGKKLTEWSAARGEWLAARNENEIGIGGYDEDQRNLITVQVSGTFAANVMGLHHELIHSDQFVNRPMPEGLSSYDQVLWRMGKEGQAYVAELDDTRRRNHLEPMTDQEKREAFITANEFYAKRYGLAEANPFNGRRLTVNEFEKAFGFVPGHEKDENFLANRPASEGGPYKTVTDIFAFSPDSPFGEVQRLAEAFKYKDLPKTDPNSIRFDSADKNYVIYVSHKNGSPDADVSIYRLEEHFGQKVYAKIDQETAESVSHTKGKESDVYGYSSFETGAQISIRVFFGKDGKMHATTQDPSNANTQPQPMTQHRDDKAPAQKKSVPEAKTRQSAPVAP